MIRDDVVSLAQKCQDLKLLYVEDDPTTREVTLEVLKEFFADITVAVDGEDGLACYKASRGSFDLILSDITMPKMNGIEMIRAIRESDKETVIVVFSAHNESSFFEQTIAIGVDGYVIKPLNIAQFIQTLSYAIEKIILRKESLHHLNLLKQYVAVANASSIVSKANTKGIITYANQNFCNISGYTEEELLGQPHNIVRHPDMPASIFKEMWHTIKDEKQIWQGIVKNRAKNGKSYYVKSTIQPILDEQGVIQEYIALRQDVTEMMSEKKQLFDFLSTNQLSVLVLVQVEDYDTLEKFYDKSNVEKIEQTFGMHLLSLMPTRCHFQKVYRLENGLFAFANERQKCRASKEELKEILEEFLYNIKEYVIKIDDIEYDISAVCSFTFGVIKTFEDAKIGIELALKEKQPIVYADGLSGIEYENALKNIETIHTIKVAIDQKKVVSYFQPIVNNLTQQIEKYESLVRLIDENGKLLSPFFFLDIAKKGRYYAKITRIVLDNSLALLQKTDKQISINLSMFDIEHAEIREYIYELLKTHTTVANRVIFELLESEDIKDLQVIKTFIHTIKSYGAQIAIDDFGTGYSNFERLLEYEPNILKIDGSLIKNIQTNQLSRNIVETIVSFAKKQNIQTVAEFVENEAIFEIVRSLGIDYSQGYAFGKPELL